MIIKEWGSPDAAKKTFVFFYVASVVKMWHLLPPESLKHSCWQADFNRRKIIHYLKHWAGQYSWAGVGLEKEADLELWRCIRPSETDPAPGSAAASGGSAPNKQTSAHVDRTVASVQLNWGSSHHHRQAVPSCSSLSLWSAGIHQTGTGRRRSALCSLWMGQRKQRVSLFVKGERAYEIWGS